MFQYQQAFTIEHSLESVYACWISEKTLFAPVQSLQIDARVGGIYQLVMPEGLIMKGKFPRVEPLKRLDFSWQWQGDDEISQVSIRFHALPEGCEIHLRHSGFKSPQSLRDHSRGWQDYIEAMRNLLASNC